MTYIAYLHPWWVYLIGLVVIGIIVGLIRSRREKKYGITFMGIPCIPIEHSSSTIELLLTCAAAYCGFALCEYLEILLR